LKRKIPVIRTIFGIIALLLFAFSMFSFYEAKKTHDWVSVVKNTEPFHLNADLSKVGSYSVTFNKIEYTGMILLAVEMDKEITSDEDLLNYVEGIKGSLSVIDPNGNVLGERNFTDNDFFYDGIYSEPSKIILPIGSMPRLKNMTFNLSIKEPAPAMANIEHKLVGRYILDLEPVVVWISVIFGSIALGISLIITVSIIIITKKLQKKISSISSMPVQ
jgi:hypothetical protein